MFLQTARRVGESLVQTGCVGRVKEDHMKNNFDFATTKTNARSLDRWKGITRPYSPMDVERLRGSVRIEHHLSRAWARRTSGTFLHTEPYVAALGAMTGNQAIQQVHAGLKSSLRQWLASRRRRQPQRRNVSRSEPVSRRQRAEHGEKDQQGAAAGGSNASRGRQKRNQLVCSADRGTAEAGFGGKLECV